MKRVGFICLHYGLDYLAYAIKSVYDSLDVILIVYASNPSHGHTTGLKCPDTRDALRDVAYSYDPHNKIQWVDGEYADEGRHRDMPFILHPDANLICVIDSDEIWEPSQFAAAQEFCFKTPVRNFKAGLDTLWRSFSWHASDQMCPDRFYRPDFPVNTFNYVPREIGQFWHFGYAISCELMEYKLSCHGHKNEMADNWLDAKYRNWSPQNLIEDTHPTCRNIWTPKPFDKNLLPQHMRQHKWWDLNLIP